MTTIDELDELNEFVHWDNAAASVGNTFPMDPALAGMSAGHMGSGVDADNIDLVLANVNEDDFSFSALQHFTSTRGSTAQMDPANMFNSMDTSTPFTDSWVTPDIPCTHCALGGYSCKTIREGRYSGYCTSCVALRVDCSFGGAVSERLSLDSTTYSSGPWHDIGARIDSLTNEDLMGDRLPPLGTSPALELMGMPANALDDDSAAASKSKPPPKIGARLSRESVRVLKNWLSAHSRHPYPSDNEKDMLQRQTGLSKTQITNWLANARRRGKVQAPRSTSPHFSSFSGSIEIPQRRGTPALEAMNPLQRWEHSPPENEPASVTAIARAVTASSSAISSGLNSPFSLNYTDDGSNRSIANQSSASSLVTSHSSTSGSRGSAYSHGSRNSWGSLGSAPFHSRTRRRRRRRATPKNPAETGTTGLTAPLKTFQCTFCTETFRTKHDWQRHEKSLHLSLERWVCAPDGPRAVNSESGQLCCVFCGLVNPDDAHIETHNHSACQERSLGERTFYRKDHLNQHLRLVHNVKFTDWSMKQWKVASPEIRSRCGFCGIVMDTWTIRVDHLAEHFKTGYSMADWKGNWGFDVPVLNMVENSIPPYLIHHERMSPLPYVATQSPCESPRNAYELIKLELAYFGANHWEEHRQAPTDEEMVLEGCRIIFASELLSLQGIATQPSWLRDLIMSLDDVSKKARFGPLRGAAESRMATLKINGKDNLFEQCPMELQLREFVKAKELLGLTAMDDELQDEACRIVGRVEEVCTHPSEAVANWLLRLITSSTSWLTSFRRRAHLPRSEDVRDEIFRSTDPRTIDSTIHSYSRLERELADFLKFQRASGVEPADEDLQRQARIIIYEFDDGWNQTAADNETWLGAFRKRHPSNTESPMSNESSAVQSDLTNPFVEPMDYHPQTQQRDKQSPGNNNFQNRIDKDGNVVKSIPCFLNDANCYRRLAGELRRWVVSTMSPNNPSSHVPSDDELKYQARWILYDDDDPWNQTAADNAEWLQRFKRDVGIIQEPGPGLPDGYAWALGQGGTGFAPPYASPKGHVDPFNGNVPVEMDTGAKPITARRSAANSFLEELASQGRRPATVFCSRELESGLVEFVQKHVSKNGDLPSDSAIQDKGKEILGLPETAADDPELLEKFKEWVRKEQLPETKQLIPEDEVDSESAFFPLDMDVQISDEELGNILQDMDFDLAIQGVSIGLPEQASDDGGVKLGGPSFHD